MERWGFGKVALCAEEQVAGDGPQGDRGRGQPWAVLTLFLPHQLFLESPSPHPDKYIEINSQLTFIFIIK